MDKRTSRRRLGSRPSICDPLSQYEVQTISTEILNKDIEDEVVNVLGPSTFAKHAYDQCFPKDNAGQKEGDVTPHQKNSQDW